MHFYSLTTYVHVSVNKLFFVFKLDINGILYRLFYNLLLNMPFTHPALV